MSAAVDVRGLVVRYDDVVAVEEASLHVPAGAFAVLVGPSGCGKTSFLRAVAGFEKPAAGSITIGDALVAGEGRFVAPEARRIGMMFQEGALFPHLSVLENVAFGANRSRAEEMLRLVSLETLADRWPHELSGGQQQRVALARALAPSPRVVLLDEPFGGLDAALRGRLRDEVREILRLTGTTAILVTHDQEEALSIADQISVMDRGRILQTGIARDIYDAPRCAEVAELVGDANLFQGTIAGGVVHTPFGEVRAEAQDGPCIIRIRTEDLCEAGSGGVTGVIVRSRFFGHDAVDDVKLEDGRIVRVRVPQSAGPPGTRVHLGLRVSQLRLFPAAGGAVDGGVQRRSVVAVP